MSNPLPQVEANFRRLLAAGKPVAIEDAAQGVPRPEGFDPRAFGAIPRKMVRDGEIVEAGFRQGKTGRCNQAVKRLWLTADALPDDAKGGEQC